MFPPKLERAIAKVLREGQVAALPERGGDQDGLKWLLRDTGPVPIADAAAPRTRARRLAIHGSVAAAVVLLAAAGPALGRPGGHRGERSRAHRRPAVRNLGTAEDGYFADGITDEVRSKIATLPQLAVIARSSVIGYKGSGKPPESIARELNARYLLSGTVRWQKAPSGSSRIRVVPQLLEMAQDRPRSGGRIRSMPSWKTCSGFKPRLPRAWRAR